METKLEVGALFVITVSACLACSFTNLVKIYFPKAIEKFWLVEFIFLNTSVDRTGHSNCIISSMRRAVVLLRNKSLLYNTNGSVNNLNSIITDSFYADRGSNARTYVHIGSRKLDFWQNSPVSHEYRNVLAAVLGAHNFIFFQLTS